MKKVLIFDCDGTLLDTITDVILSFNEALDVCGFPKHPVAYYDNYIGGNLETIVSGLLPQSAVSRLNVEAVKAKYREIYGNSSKTNTKPYPGIMTLLKEWKTEGYLIAINTNKGQQLTEALIDKLFKKDFFDAIVGYSEERPSKPDPYGVDMICRELHAERQNCVYIGDGKSDVQTAFRAGIPCIYVKWGQGKAGDTEDAPVYAEVSTMDELKRAVHNVFDK